MSQQEKSHPRTDKQAGYQCPVCSKHFSTVDGLQGHIRFKLDIISTFSVQSKLENVKIVEGSSAARMHSRTTGALDIFPLALSLFLPATTKLNNSCQLHPSILLPTIKLSNSDVISATRDSGPSTHCSNILFQVGIGSMSGMERIRKALTTLKKARMAQKKNGRTGRAICTGTSKTWISHSMVQIMVGVDIAMD